MSVRRARPHELERVRQLYRETDYGGTVAPDDIVLVAEHGTRLVGVFRFCDEFGVAVLRGMRVRKEFQRQGIGTALLRAGASILENRICYCIAYRHLRAFYGRVGFAEIPLAGAPQGLQDRLAAYRQRGLDVILTRRHPIGPNMAERHLN